MTQTNDLERVGRAGEIFRQLQLAKSMKLVVGIDALVLLDNPVFKEPCSQIVAHTETSPLQMNSKKLYVRFAAGTRYDKIVEVKDYIQSNFGFKCDICDWSFPTRLDISL